jgi:hypothetical protein
MGNDRELFVEDPNAIPIYEGRMVEAFDHRAKAYVSGRARQAIWADLHFGAEQKKIAPQWRILEADVPSGANVTDGTANKPAFPQVSTVS